MREHPQPAMIIPADDPLALAVVDAIHAGDLDHMKRMLAEDPHLATATIGSEDHGENNDTTRSLLHIVTDWPGHYPNGAATVALLVDAGADVNARLTGPHTETPLHWAASSDDIEVLDALLDAGADLEAPGAVIGGGTPISDATAFGQWRASRRLLERGARTTFWEAATLGLRDDVETACASSTPPASDDITAAFWGACHGGQRSVAEYLLERGAGMNSVGWDDLTPLDAAQRSGADELVEWLRANGGRSASEL